MRGGAKVVIEPHRHEGIFVARGKEDALVTLNSTPGVAVYGEKRISVENPSATPGGVAEKVEYRVWNPFRSKCKIFRSVSGTIQPERTLLLWIETWVAYVLPLSSFS